LKNTSTQKSNEINIGMEEIYKGKKHSKKAGHYTITPINFFD